MHPAGAFHHPAQPPPPFSMAHNAPAFPMQQQHYHHHHNAPLYGTVQVQQPLPPPAGIPVSRVWDENFEAELCFLHSFAANARYAAVSIHYPGVVHGDGQNPSLQTSEDRYRVIKLNVDALKPIQVGLAVYNANGHVAAWEFNLCDFDPATDRNAPSSIAYLQRCGLSFRDHRARGITSDRLAVGLHGCRLFGRPGLSLITYAGDYHIAYLVKILSMGNPLPNDQGGFLHMVRQFLGEDVYDVARMAVDHGLPLGLEHVARALSLVQAALSPRLAANSSVLALQGFVKFKYVEELVGGVNRFRGLIHGIQVV